MKDPACVCLFPNDACLPLFGLVCSQVGTSPHGPGPGMVGPNVYIQKIDLHNFYLFEVFKMSMICAQVWFCDYAVWFVLLCFCVVEFCEHVKIRSLWGKQFPEQSILFFPYNTLLVLVSLSWGPPRAPHALRGLNRFQRKTKRAWAERETFCNLPRRRTLKFKRISLREACPRVAHVCLCGRGIYICSTNPGPIWSYMYPWGPSLDTTNLFLMQSLRTAEENISSQMKYENVSPNHGDMRRHENIWKK